MRPAAARPRYFWQPPAWDFHADAFAAFDLRLAPVEFLHGQLRRDVRAAAAVAEIHGQVERDTQPLALAHAHCMQSCHCGLAGVTGPSGAHTMPLTSIHSTPPTPTRFMASRSAVMPVLLMLPLIQNQ